MSIDDLRIDSIGLTEGEEDDIVLGGHYVTYSDNFMFFECRKCETSFDVPDIFQASTASNKIIYQLYILSHYRREECPKKDMMTPAIQGGRRDAPPPPNQQPPPQPPGSGNVHWFNNSTFQIDVGDGDVVTDGSVIIDSTSSQFDVGDALTDQESMALMQDAQAQMNRKT